MSKSIFGGLFKSPKYPGARHRRTGSGDSMSSSASNMSSISRAFARGTRRRVPSAPPGVPGAGPTAIAVPLTPEEEYIAEQQRRQAAGGRNAAGANVAPADIPAGRRFRVTIPSGVGPGTDFTVQNPANVNQSIRVRCPPGASPGTVLQISVPFDTEPAPAPPQPPYATPPPETYSPPPSVPPPPAAPRSVTPPEAPPEGVRPLGTENYPEAEPLPAGSAQPDDTNLRYYTVVIPGGTNRGDTFPIMRNGAQYVITCPQDNIGGHRVRIALPNPLSDRKPKKEKKVVEDDGELATYEVMIPNGVLPGQQFALMAAGRKVIITCPPNARGGMTIRFRLPKVMGEAGIEAVRLSYDKDGWSRTVRAEDMTFQWVKTDDMNNVLPREDVFDVEKSAFVRQIKPEGLSLDHPSAGRSATRVVSYYGRDVADHHDLSQIQPRPYQEKVDWFRERCNELRTPWNSGHVQLTVDRNRLLDDSQHALLSLQPVDLHRIWKFEFMREPGIDAGGPSKEFYECVSKLIFDPNLGLWTYSAVNQMCMQINNTGEMDEEELDITRSSFRFLGRFLGKALFDGHLLPIHLVRHIYKHLLGWPVCFDDIQFMDDEIHRQMLNCLDYDEETLGYTCLDFTVTENYLGMNRVVELKPGGADIDVDKSNLLEYIELRTKYILLEKSKMQLHELLTGFYEVVPEALLSIFDFQELELMMCGLPDIDVDDWRINTEYVGLLRRKEEESEVVQWFWEVVAEDFTQEQKARLLQFVTGTSGVPGGGFALLQGNEQGVVRRFTLNGMSLDHGLYPVAHTCFNRLDLPMYSTKEELKKIVTIVINLEVTGFGIE